jgi:hypothetical protein
MFRLVEGIIGSQQQAFRHRHRPAMPGEGRGYADTGSDHSNRVAFMGDSQLLNGMAHRFGYCGSAYFAGIGQDDSDLLTSVARDQIGTAKR